MTALRQGSAAWHEARRVSVSSTDLAVILGLSPYRAEWDLAAEKLGQVEREPATLPMRVGLALERLIGDEYERETGARLRRVRTLAVHPDIPWAVASPDFRVVGQAKGVEAKWTTSRRWADGLPQDVECQVQWCLGVTGWPRADVAVLVGGSELRIHPVERDDDLFAGLVDIAADFRSRLAAGGPFAQTLDSLKRRYPSDAGTVLDADPDMVEAVRTLLDVKGRTKALAADEERLEALVKARMADAASMTGPGFRVDWKQSKGAEVVDWRNVAEGLLAGLSPEEREALVSLNTRVKPGARPFRVYTDREDTA